jgi:hypothetical protein
MRYFIFPFILFLSACVFNEQTGKYELDVNVLNQELKVAQEDVGDLMILVEGDDKVYIALSKFKNVLGKVQSVLQLYIDAAEQNPQDLLSVLEYALLLSDELIEDLGSSGSAQRAKFGIMASRMVLRRVRVYLE